MKELFLKRNELRRNSIKTSIIKFDDDLKEKDVGKLMKEHEKIYNKWKFYDGMVKALNNKKKE